MVVYNINFKMKDNYLDILIAKQWLEKSFLGKIL